MASLLARVRAFVLLESTGLTLAFWTAVLLQSLAFLLCPYPPMIDYPQHVAMGAVFHRMLDRSAPEWQIFETNLFTYNAGFPTVLAYLSYLFRPELAGRVLFFFYPILWASAALAFCDLAKRPRWYAALAIPIAFHFTAGWGFANYVLTLPIALLAFAGWVRIAEGSRSRLLIGVVIATTLAVAYTHVLVTLSICICVGVVGLERLLRQSDDRIADRIRSLVVPAIVMVPAVVYSLAAWWWARETSHTFWEHAWADGTDEPAWQKLRYLVYNLSGNFLDHSDQNLTIAAAGIGVAVWIHAFRAGWEPRMRHLAIVFFALYLVVPKVMLGTFHIYIRLLPIAAIFAVAALPVVRDGVRWLAVAAVSIAVVSGGNLLHKFLTIPEVDDAMAIIDDIPEGRAVIGVTWDPKPAGWYREIWVHLPAIYQARRRGLIAYTFARNESPPIRYQAGKEPLRPPGGFEWNGSLYDVHQPYARKFDTVLVRGWIDPTSGRAIEDPAPYVFKDLASYMPLMSRRGRFFLYDASVLGRMAEGGASALPAAGQ